MKKIILMVLMLFLFANLTSAFSIVSVNSGSFAPGEQGIISLEIENERDHDMRDVSIVLDLSDDNLPIAPVDSSASVFVDELDVGDDERIEFSLIVLPEAALGVYKIPVLVTYTGYNDSLYEIEEMISLIVASEPKLSLRIDDPDFIIGDFADISIGIVNEGLSDVKFLKVKIEESDFFDVLSNQEVYVGELSSDDFDRVDFKLLLNDPLASISIPITLEYYDSTNKFYSHGDSLRISVYSEKEAEALGLLEVQRSKWWIFALLFVILMIVRKVKKRKR